MERQRAPPKGREAENGSRGIDTGIERRSRAAMIEESEAGNEKTKTTGS